MELPVLIKEPNKEYFVGCDIIHEKGREIFTFNVAEQRKDKTILFIHCEQVVNEFKTEQDKKYLQYIESLSSFYDCKVMYEVH